MSKPFKSILIVFLLSFLFILNVKAECSYQERKDLLNAAKNVDISVEPVQVDDEYDFKFNVVGLTDNIFIKYYNTNNGNETYIHTYDLNDGVYSFVDENSFMIYTYRFVFYSNNPNCTGYEIKTKSIKKPMYNRFSENLNCEFEQFKNFKYCKKFFTTDYKLTDSNFYKFLEKYGNEINKNNDNAGADANSLISYINKYIFFIMVGFVIVFGLIFYIVLINKKRNKL